MNTVLETNDFHIDFQFMENPLQFDNIRLYQVGKKFCNSKTVVLSHTHIDWFEITAILEGKGEIFADKKKSVPVKQGDLFLSYPCDIHKIVSDTESPMKYSFLSFSIPNGLYKKEFEQITQNFYEVEKRLFHDSAIEFLIELIIGEMSVTEFEQQKIISLSLQQILTFIVRDFLYNQVKTIPSHKTNDEILCYKIMRYIDNNIFSIRNLTEISDYFHYNYSYLAKVFKQITNTTITQYFSNKKLERAKILIQQEDLTFTKIADLLNYSSIYSFSKSFKFHFGIYPTEYKKNQNKQ